MGKEKQGRPRGRTIPWFYLIYLICVAAALAGIFIACAVVRVLLAEYEGAQPKYVAAAAFETYFSPIDYDKLLSETQYDAGFASPEAVQDYLSGEIGQEELSWSIGSSNDPNEFKYIVKAGRKQIGNIILTSGAEKTSHGFRTYDFSHVELSLDPAAIPGGVVTISAPASCTVTVDGAVLTEAQRTDTYLDTKALKYYPSGISGIEYAVYSLPELEELPRKISVTDAFGAQSEVTFDPSSSAYSAGPAYSETLAAEHGPFVTKAVEGYAAYMQRVPGSSFSGIRKYFDPDSSLYRAISAASRDLWMVFTPTGNDFQNVEVGEFHAYGEDIISCHISFIQMVYLAGQDRPDVIDMYVFLHRTDSGWRIYEWYNNNI